MTTPDCWVILGASSAIARAFARVAAADGADILLAGRDRGDLEASAADLRARFGRRVEIAEFDAAADDSHARVLNRAAAFAGPALLGAFVAFGVMPDQSEVEAQPALTRQVVDVNFTAVAQLLQAAAPLFEARKAGRIVVLGSVAGDRGRLSNYVYGAAKAGLHAYLQGVRARLFHSGVSVTTVKPGPVDTAMTYGRKNLPLLAAPETVATACYKAALRGADQIYTPAPWRLIMAILRAIPERVFKRLKL